MQAGRTERWRRDPRIGWSAAVGVGCTALFVVVGALLASPAAHPIDASFSHLFRAVRTPALSVVAIGLTALGGVVAVSAVTSVAVLFLLWSRKVGAALFVLFSVLPGWLIASLLKGAFARPRPQGVSIVPLPIDFALPSGHTVAAALCYGSIAILLVVNARHVWVRWAAPAVTILLVTGVAWSRVYLGVHWFGDVAAALLYSAAWLGFCTVSYLGSVTESQRRTEPGHRS